MTQRITAWSYSRYQAYTECPAKAKYKFIDKLPEPPAPAMDRGTAIHKMAENYAKGVSKKIPEELKNFTQKFTKLKKAKPIVEQEWAFDKMWKPTDWFGPQAWLRVKMDASYKDQNTLYVIDHKT